MKTVAEQQNQTMQRVRVGMIGLAAVILLIGLVSAIFSAVSRERPVAVAGSTTGPTGNLALANAVAPNEPLSELGAAPAADANGAAPAAAK